jgi:Cof subfamily protein (haloacid dehalogenase superfamily)
MKKVAFFDWDGTLSHNGRDVHPLNEEAIAKWRAAGHLAVLATGRAVGWLPEKGVALCPDALVAGAGACVRLGEKDLVRRYLSNDDLSRFIAHFLEDGQTCILEGERYSFVINNNGTYRDNCGEITEPIDYGATYPEYVITKLTLLGETMSEASKALFSHLDIIYNPSWIEILPAGCSKSAGMYAVMDALGLPRENSIAFGDSGNDLDMLQAAGIGVAMPHAPVACREAARYTAPPPHEGGVGQVLLHLLEECI